jgi:hypothetical protein
VGRPVRSAKSRGSSDGLGLAPVLLRCGPNLPRASHRCRYGHRLLECRQYWAGTDHLFLVTSAPISEIPSRSERDASPRRRLARARPYQGLAALLACPVPPAGARRSVCIRASAGQPPVKPAAFIISSSGKRCVTGALRLFPSNRLNACKRLLRRKASPAMPAWPIARELRSEASEPGSVGRRSTNGEPRKMTVAGGTRSIHPAGVADQVLARDAD